MTTPWSSVGSDPATRRSRPEVARRLGVPDEPWDPRPRALVAAALGCLNVAVDLWTAADGAVPLADLVDQAMGAVGGIHKH